MEHVKTKKVFAQESVDKDEIHEDDQEERETHGEDEGTVTPETADETTIRASKGTADDELTDIDDRPTQRLRGKQAVNRQAEQRAKEKAGVQIPQSYRQAVNDQVFGEKWQEAIRDELTALIKFETWRQVPRVPDLI